MRPTPESHESWPPWETSVCRLDRDAFALCSVFGLLPPTHKSVIGGVTETYTYDRYGNITAITTAGQTTKLAPDAATIRPAPRRYRSC